MIPTNQFILKIATNAIENNKDIAEMLRSVAERLEKGVDAGVIRSNGKIVGTFNLG